MKANPANFRLHRAKRVIAMPLPHELARRVEDGVRHGLDLLAERRCTRVPDEEAVVLIAAAVMAEIRNTED